MNDLESLLHAELARRRARNPRYSLRAFARQLGVDHSTLSQWLRGRRALTATAATTLRGALDARVHRAVLDLASRDDFKADSRWIARQLDLSIDDVNRALQTLIRTHRLDMSSPARWTAKETCP